MFPLKSTKLLTVYIVLIYTTTLTNGQMDQTGGSLQQLVAADSVPSEDFAAEAEYLEAAEQLPLEAQIEELRAELDASISGYRQEQLSYAAAYSLIMILSLAGNFLVVKVCLANLTKTNVLILSLATSDLLMSIFNIPLNYIRLLNYSWPFGSFLCFISNFVKHLAVYNSSYTMALIAIQRYYSICVGCHGDGGSGGGSSGCLRRLFAPSHTRSKLAPLRAIVAIVLAIWLFSGTISTMFTYTSKVVTRENIYSVIYELYIKNASSSSNEEGVPGTSGVTSDIDPKSFLMYRCTNPLPTSVERWAKQVNIQADLIISLLVFATQYFAPLSIACILYIRIGKTIARQGRLASLKQNSQAQARERKKRRRILMLILVVVAFSLCWAPIHLFHLAVDARLIDYNYQLFMAVHWLAMSSVIYNPFIYCWLNESFRKAAIRLICCQCCGCRSTTGSGGGRSCPLISSKATTAATNPAAAAATSGRISPGRRSHSVSSSIASQSTEINETNGTVLRRIGDESSEHTIIKIGFDNVTTETHL